MNNIGLLYHPMKDAAYILAKKLEEFLAKKGVTSWVCSAWEGETARNQVNGTDLVLSIGGDGTILRAAQAVIPGPTPITGINLGNLGFMTELAVDEAEDKLTALLSGKGWIDERSLIEAELSIGDGESIPSRKLFALNDVVVARAEVTRVIYVEAIIDDKSLTTYKADGVIVATATGSTGYSLAAGGPVLHPHAKDLLLLPITPHLSSSYSLVLPSTAVVKLRLDIGHSVTLSLDGHTNLPVSSGATVTVKHSSYTVRFLRIHPEISFYGSLEQRLKGKQ